MSVAAILNPGDLDRRVAFDEPMHTTDSAGAEVQVWTERFTRWAAVHPATGREGNTASQILAEADTRIIVRHDSQTALITAKWRARLGSTVYNLVAPPIDVRSQHVRLELLCSTGNNAG